MTVAPLTWQDRITGFSRDDPAQLLAHPHNARIHPRLQQDVLAATIRELGYLVPVIVNDTTGHTLDGHLRIEQAISDGQPTIPVIHVALPEDLEAEALLTIDPIAALAVIDRQAMAVLLERVETDSETLTAFLADEAVRVGVTPPVDPRAEWVGMPEFEQADRLPVKQVLVSFASPADLEEFARLVGQTVTMRTKSIWFPAQPEMDYGGAVYVSEASDDAP